MTKFEPLDLSEVTTHPIAGRDGKVGLDALASPPRPEERIEL